MLKLGPKLAIYDKKTFLDWVKSCPNHFEDDTTLLNKIGKVLIKNVHQTQKNWGDFLSNIQSNPSQDNY